MRPNFTLMVIPFLAVLGSIEVLTRSDGQQNTFAFVNDPCSAIVCGSTGGEVSKKALLDMGRIELRGCGPSTQVTGFKMTVVHSDNAGEEVVVELSVDGAAPSASMKDQLKLLPVGSKVYFEDIRVVDAEGRKHLVGSLVVTLS